jgi:hypothetical protein
LRDSIGLDQDDVPIGIVFFRLQRCPQSREATADDRQLGIFIAREIRCRLRTLGSIEPVATGLGALKCLFVSFDVGLSLAWFELPGERVLTISGLSLESQLSKRSPLES